MSMVLGTQSGKYVTCNPIRTPNFDAVLNLITGIVKPEWGCCEETVHVGRIQTSRRFG